MKLSSKLGTVAVSLALIAGAAGCSSGPSSTSASGSKVTLDWGFWSQGNAGDKTWQGVAEAVNKKYPNISVNLTSPPFAGYFTKLQSELAAGNAPCIVSMQSLRLPAFADAMLPLGDLMKSNGFNTSDWTPAALKALQVNGKQYAIPYGFSTMLMYYNKDAFAAAGLPAPKAGWTMNDFEADAKKLTATTGKPAFGQSFSDLHMYSMLLANNGAKPVTSDAKLDLTNPTMEKSFSWYSGLSTSEKVASVPASSSDIPWGEQQFVAGNVAMAVDGDWDLAQNATGAKFNVGVAPLPQGVNGGGTFSANSGFGISATCKHPAEAAKAIAVLTGAQESAAAAEQGANVPARIADGPKFIAALKKQVDPKTPGFSEQVQQTMAASDKMAIPFISTNNWDEVTQDMARQFILSYTGSQSPTKSLQSVQQTDGQ